MMRISEIIASLVPKVRAIGPSKGAEDVSRAAKIHSRPDQVQLSGESQLLSRLESELKTQSNSVDEAKVKELRDKIESGEYNPDTHDIAAKIMGMEK